MVQIINEWNQQVDLHLAVFHAASKKLLCITWYILHFFIFFKSAELLQECK